VSRETGGWIRAERLVVSAERVLRPGWLHHVDGWIVAVGEGEAPRRAVDLGAVVAPGCVNAHAHLDLGAFPAGRVEGERFGAWLQKLVRAKAARPETAACAAISAGIARSLEAGTTAVADIDTSGSAALLAASPLRSIALREVLGLDPAALEGAIERALTERAAPEGRHEIGLSPHAPYSTAADALARAARWLEVGAAVQMHVLETPEERLWCEREEGPFGDTLRALGVPETRLRAWRARPLDVLAAAGLLRPRFSIAHGNELEEDEVARLVRAGVGVVFCPGTHLAFERTRDPLTLLERLGCAWGLGTDGEVSGGTLDLRAQARLGAQIHPELSARRWFDAATRGGARVLGLPTGELLPDRLADWVAYELDGAPRDADALFAAWLAGDLRVREIWIGGAAVAPRPR
jgi:cytosine/adenosine deaminase-related metal-dependent hydrolase